MTDAEDIPTLTDEIVDAEEYPMGVFKILELPPLPNTHIHLGDPPGDVVYHFHRDKPFTRFQVWMIGWCFGWRVEQDLPAEEPKNGH